MAGNRRRDRDRRPGRRAPFREPKRVILVVCEGARTEPDYLRQFARLHGAARVELRFGAGAADPKSLVNEAKRLKREAAANAKRSGDDFEAFDQVWCVFDIDDHLLIHEARQMADANDILLAVSNPSFELWLLLHFQDCGMRHRSKVLELLKGQVPHFAKGALSFTDFEAGYGMAVVRAVHLDRAADDAGEPGRNPTTGVHLLTETVRNG